MTEICSLYNEGKMIKEISEKMMVTDDTVSKYLKIADKIGMCNYRKHKNIQVMANGVPSYGISNSCKNSYIYKNFYWKYKC